MRLKWTSTKYFSHVKIGGHGLMPLVSAFEEFSNELSMCFQWVLSKIQGDHSHRFQPHVDSKTKVVFRYMDLIIKRNFCFEVNRRLETTWIITLYTKMKEFDLALSFIVLTASNIRDWAIQVEIVISHRLSFPHSLKMGNWGYSLRRCRK